MRARVPGVQDVNVFGEGLHVTVSADSIHTIESDIQSTLARGGQDRISLRRIEPSMEDVFFQLTAERS